MTLARLELLMQPRCVKDFAAHEIKQVGRTLAGKRRQPEPETKLPRIDSTLGDVLKHEIKQFGRALIKKPRVSMGPSSVQWRKAGFRDQLAHEAQQVVRTMFGKKRTRMPKWIAEQRKHPLNKKTVLVVDEAGMIGTKQFTRLLDAAHKSGAMVVFVGDGRQLPAIEAGSPFSALIRVSPYAELKEIVRQKDSRDRDVVLKASRGETRSILTEFAERGQLTVAPNRAEAMQALVRDWVVGHGAKPETAAILCGTRAEAAELNRLCQNARLNSTASTGASVTCGDEKFYHGDRVMFTRNSRVLGVNNGDTGTVLTLKDRPSSITVRLDKGGRVSVSLKDYEHVQLGYAFTTHKLQGATISSAYVLTGGAMQDREMTYVQLSRAAEKTRLYADENEAGSDLANLAKQMNTSRMKQMARDVAKAPWQPLPEIQR